MVFSHEVDPQLISDMAIILADVRQHSAVIPDMLANAWRQQSDPIFSHQEKLPKKPPNQKPACWELGVCICGENEVTCTRLAARRSLSELVARRPLFMRGLIHGQFLC